MKRLSVLFLITLWVIISSGIHSASAGDLDDGISKYTDDSIKKYDELGSGDMNINYIKMNAKSRAKVRARKGEDAAEEGGNTDADAYGMQGVGALNSVIVGAGGTIKGDVIIIDESKGDKTQVVE